MLKFQTTDLLHPELWALWPWLLALACLHLLLLIQQWWWQRRQFSAEALRAFGPGISLGRGLLKWALWTAAGGFLLLAVSVPQGPAVKVEGRQPGADVILCVDVSSSMLAMDVQPNRLQAVKTALGSILDQLQGDRVGLVAFAGDPVVACPLTTDSDTTSLFLEKLDIDSVPRDGTGLGAALKMALDSFDADPERGRLIVLATDGEDTADSDALEQARRAKESGVPIFTVGIGTPEGALIPGRRDVFGRVYAKMYNGQPVRTKLDSAGLRKIATAAGGEYVAGTDARALARAAARVRQLKQGLTAMPDRFVREPLYQDPLLWALLLLLAESLLSLRAGGLRHLGAWAWGRWAKVWAKRASQSAGLLLLLALSSQAFAWDEGRQAFNEGNQRYRQGDYAGAAEAYQRSAQADAAKAQTPFNLGNAYFQQQDYQNAVSAYESALALDSKDPDIQHNLDLARRRLQQQQEQEGKDGQGQKDSKPGKDQGQGQGKPGQGQGQQQGGQPKPGQGNAPGQPRPGAASRLKQDQVQAMMNQLRLDQKRYSGAFNPMKKYDRPDRKPEDPMDQMLQQMGVKPPSQAQQAPGSGPPPKDW